MGLNRATELERLTAVLEPPPPGYYTAELIAECPNVPPVTVWERTREVLALVVGRDAEYLEGLEKAPHLLPGWFVAASAPETTQEEAQSNADRVRQMSAEELERHEQTCRWSVGQFVYWFRPEMRTWWWWGVTAEPRALRVVVVTEEAANFPYGALLWLLRAAGAGRAEFCL